MPIPIQPLEARHYFSIVPFLVDTPDRDIVQHVVTEDYVYYTVAAKAPAGANVDATPVELHRYRISTQIDQRIASPDDGLYFDITYFDGQSWRLAFTASSHGKQVLYALYSHETIPRLLTTRALEIDQSTLVQAVGAIFFAGTDRANGRELWCADGEPARRLTNLAPGRASSDVNDLRVGKDQVIAFTNGNTAYRTGARGGLTQLYSAPRGLQLVRQYRNGWVLLENLANGEQRVVFTTSKHETIYAAGTFDYLVADHTVPTEHGLYFRGYDAMRGDGIWRFDVDLTGPMQDVVSWNAHYELSAFEIAGSDRPSLSVRIDDRPLRTFVLADGLLRASKWMWFSSAVCAQGTYYYVNALGELFQSPSPLDKGFAIATDVRKVYLNRGKVYADRKDGVYVLSTNTGAVAGKVWLDRNHDGRYVPGNRIDSGIPGVTVWADLNNNGLIDRREPRTVTDNQGRYELGGLAFGDVPIRMSGLRRDMRSLTPDVVVASARNALALVDFAATHRTIS